MKSSTLSWAGIGIWCGMVAIGAAACGSVDGDHRQGVSETAAPAQQGSDEAANGPAGVQAQQPDPVTVSKTAVGPAAAPRTDFGY